MFAGKWKSVSHCKQPPRRLCVSASYLRRCDSSRIKHYHGLKYDPFIHFHQLCHKLRLAELAACCVLTTFSAEQLKLLVSSLIQHVPLTPCFCHDSSQSIQIALQQINHFAAKAAATLKTSSCKKKKKKKSLWLNTWEKLR